MKRGTIEHPKTRRLAEALGIAHAHAVGLLESLWHATAKYARRGDIGRLPNVEIAMACLWEGDADVFVESLVACRWLDRHPDHRLIVHDWADHADDATKKAVRRMDGDFVRTSSASVQTCPDMSGQRRTAADSGGECRDMSRLPEPEPEPEPEPMPGPAEERAPRSERAAASRPQRSLPPAEPPVRPPERGGVSATKIPEAVSDAIRRFRGREALPTPVRGKLWAWWVRVARDYPDVEPDVIASAIDRVRGEPDVAWGSGLFPDRFLTAIVDAVSRGEFDVTDRFAHIRDLLDADQEASA